MTDQKYWETRLPQSYCTSTTPGTVEYERAVRKIRYSRHKYIKPFTKISRFKSKKLLEVGAGIGTDLLYFAEKGVNVTGIDFTQSSIETCKKRFAFCKQKGNFKQMDAQQLQFPDNSFDVVYSFGVLHHVPDTKKAIAEVYRVLKQDGRAIIRVNAKGWWYYVKIIFWLGILKGGLFRMSKQELMNKNTTVRDASPLVKYYNRKQLKHLFKNFKITRVQRNYLGGKFAFMPYWLSESLLGRFIGNHWMLELKKK